MVFDSKFKINLYHEHFSETVKKYTRFPEFNPSRPDLGQIEKINLNFYFTLLCGASKGIIKPFETPQRSMKIKI